mgnify:CR=1 FL=1
MTNRHNQSISYGHHECKDCGKRTVSERRCPECGALGYYVMVAGMDFPAPLNGWGR